MDEKADSGEFEKRPDGSVSLNSAKGEIVLEITVVPGLGKTDEMVVMARDMTMERNLRTALVESRQRDKDLA